MQLIVDGHEYFALGSNALHETEYEAIILQRRGEIYPGWEVVPFKVPVESEHGRRVPDLALISPDCRAWWVVEVEMAHHDPISHVLPQVAAFSGGFYGDSHVAALCRYLPELPSTRIREMVRDVEPGVHVVVNCESAAWHPILAPYGIELATVELYRSRQNAIALRISGRVPQLQQRYRTRLVRDGLARNAFRMSDARLSNLLGERFSIAVDGRMTEWCRPSAHHELVLPLRGDPFPDRQSIVVTYFLDGRVETTASQPDNWTGS